MGLCTSMPLFNSRVKPSSEIPDTSTSCTLIIPPSSTPISRELNPLLMSRHTSRRTEIISTGVNSRSTADPLEEVSRRLMMQQQKP
uniref:AC4 n=1 Tax=Sweet potato leaf curl Guangxi virus TaxID=1489312 RepID=A0A5P8N6A4_9GEMI|nr:AC4 [Sweet potato leaf curl Guangxi virus]